MKRLILIFTFVITIAMGSAIAKEVTKNNLPISRVILSTSGMAYFEHEANIDGNTKVKIPVRLDQVDDMLKSLIVYDTKGQIGSITLPGRQPLDQIFRDLPFSRGDIQSPVQLLNALQGADVKISGAVNAQGLLVRVIPEMVQLSDGRNLVQHHRLSLLTSEGLKQVVLEDLNSVQFTDPALRAQLAEALNAVRNHSTKDQRVLTVDLKGKGARNVALAYVIDAPLWKAAYRFVLPENEDTGFVQGWAVVENMTGANWDNVELSLVSGNPVTYRQALYPSYHVQRPELPVEVLGRVMPRVDSGVLEKAEQKTFADTAKRERRAMASAPMAMEMDAAPAYDEALASAPMKQMAGGRANIAYDMAQMANAAASADATTQVLFRFPDKFDLDAGHSMMLPFVSRKLPMEKLWLYQPDTHPKHPLASIRLTNKGDSGLPPGIATLYQQDKNLGGTSFVGDAQMPVLAKGEERLISYALDSKTLIDREFKNNQREGQITIAKGVMKTAIKYRNETIYTIKAPAEQERLVMIEHPKQGNYEIVAPPKKDVDVTDRHYRVRVPVKAGESKKISVVLENDAWQSIQIAGLDTRTLQAYATKRGKLDPKTRKIFERLANLRGRVDAVEQEIQRLIQARQEIYNDQNRLRENIKSLPGDSDLRKRYLERLDDQEDSLEDIEEKLQSLNEEKNRRLKDLKDEIFRIKI